MSRDNLVVQTCKYHAPILFLEIIQRQIKTSDRLFVEGDANFQVSLQKYDIPAALLRQTNRSALSSFELWR